MRGFSKNIYVAKVGLYKAQRENWKIRMRDRERTGTSGVPDSSSRR
jgi:hypothetical protein